MDLENLIPAQKICSSYEVELSFISSLGQSGLIEITEQDNAIYIHISQLPVIERYSRLYYDLDINLEGIEAITHLLERMNQMQAEITVLRNRLKQYESF